MYTVYGQPNCSYCDRAEELLEAYYKDYEYIDVRSDPESLQMFKRHGYATTPQVFKGDRHIGGYDQLKIHLKGEPVFMKDRIPKDV